MRPSPIRVARRFLGLKYFKLEHHGLKGLDEGKPVTLYHGTTKMFKTFDMSQSREELVNDFYGAGIFLTPSKKVAWEYAHANRNKLLPPSIIEDLKRVSPGAGTFLESLVRDGHEKAWDKLVDRPEWDIGTFEASLQGVDVGDLGFIAENIEGSNAQPASSEHSEAVEALFGSGRLAGPSYEMLDKVGLDSVIYRPKMYTVTVSGIHNVLVTTRKASARAAKRKGHDCVVFHGADLVDNAPEVVVYDPRKVKIKKVEVLKQDQSP